MAGVETELQLTDVASELQDTLWLVLQAVRTCMLLLSSFVFALQPNAIHRKVPLVTFKFRQNAAVDPEQLARFVFR